MTRPGRRCAGPSRPARLAALLAAGAVWVGSYALVTPCHAQQSGAESGAVRAAEGACRSSLCQRCGCALRQGKCRPAPVEFCGKAVPADTRTLTCYEGRIFGSAKPGASALDLKPLTCLPRLEELQLVSGELEFIGTLPIEDPDELASLKGLRVLRLGHTTVDSLDFVRGLTELEELSVHASPVQSLEPLVGLTKLRELDLSGSRVVDLTPLGRLTALERLDLTGAPVTDLRPLESLAKLRWLGLSDGSSVAASQRERLQARNPELRITEGRRY